MKIINLGNKIVNTYLVNLGNKSILIDTGYPGGEVSFFKKLKKYDINPGNIDFLILTHAHDDHAGFLEKVLSVSNARLVLNNESVGRLLLGHNEWIGGCSGILAYIFIKSLALFGKGKHEYPKFKIPKQSIIWDGQDQYFEKTGLPVRLISLPGHTADQIGVLIDNRILFCGDAVMNGFPSIKRNIIWIENLDMYKESWDKIIKMNCELIYPSHGKPFEKNDLKKYRNHLNKIKIIKMKPQI